MPQEMLDQFDIKRLPLFVTLNDKTCYDGVDITPKEIFTYVEKNGTLPKTAARSVGDFIDFFRPFVEEGCDVIFIGIGTALSSTTQNARLAGEELGHVYVF